MKRNGWFWGGACIVFIFIVCALIPGKLASNLPNATFWPAWDANGVMLKRPLLPGQQGLLLGSDTLGRDLFSRVVWGARFSLGLALGITVLRAVIAVPVGLWTGWGRGMLPKTVGAVANGASAIPVLLILVIVLRPLKSLTSVVGLSTWLTIFSVVVAISGVPRLVEAIRRRVEAARGAAFLEGAVATGARRGWILRRHVVPGLLPELAVMVTAEIAWVLLLLGQLGVLGVYLGGGQTDPLAGTTSDYYPEWAQMLAVGRGGVLSAPHVLLVPGIALTSAAMGFHMMAEGLRRHWQRIV